MLKSLSSFLCALLDFCLLGKVFILFLDLFSQCIKLPVVFSHILLSIYRTEILNFLSLVSHIYMSLSLFSEDISFSF